MFHVGIGKTIEDIGRELTRTGHVASGYQLIEHHATQELAKSLIRYRLEHGVDSGLQAKRREQRMRSVEKSDFAKAEWLDVVAKNDARICPGESKAMLRVTRRLDCKETIRLADSE